MPHTVTEGPTRESVEGPRVPRPSAAPTVLQLCTECTADNLHIKMTLAPAAFLALCAEDGHTPIPAN